MSEKTTKLTPKKNKAIAALLEQPTIEAAAEIAGVNPRTIHRWLKDRAFLVGLRDAEGLSIDRTARRLISLADKALEAIEDIIDNPKQPGASNKRLAAQAILDQMLRLRELRNIEGRISDLEVAVYGQSK